MAVDGLSVTEWWEVGNLLLFIILSLRMELGMPMLEFLEIKWTFRYYSMQIAQFRRESSENPALWSKSVCFLLNLAADL